MAGDRPGHFAHDIFLAYIVHFKESTSSYFTAIGSCSLKTVADLQRHAGYHNKQYSDKTFTGVNIDDLEWPWISEIKVLVFFLQFVAAA